jgi:hypothetical protein
MLALAPVAATACEPGPGFRAPTNLELAAIEPHPAALRAILDLDSLPVTHRQRHAAYRALHRGDIGFGTHRVLSSH